MSEVISKEQMGENLKDYFAGRGIIVNLEKAIEAPQAHYWKFTISALTSLSALNRAIKELGIVCGFQCEKDEQNGGFTISKKKAIRQFVGFGNCEPSIEKALSADINGEKKGYICFGQGQEDFITTNFDECAHILIAGTTGSGKSVCLHSLAMQLLVFSTANLVLIDGKGGAEFGIYEQDVHHRIEKVCKDTSSALEWLNICVNEMERRYKEMERKGLKKYDGNKIVIVIDELADLMMTSKNEVEEYIVRIAQKGRASGIHLIVATQVPYISVVTGLIKYNLPTKVCLKTANQRHSMNIIDCGKGAELLDKGDAYISLPNSPYLKRCQTCFISQDNMRRLLTTK